MKLYTAETILPGPDFEQEVSGFLVDQGKIRKILPDTSAVSNAKGTVEDWIAFEEGCILPGITDSHTHLRLLGKSLQSTDLEGIQSIQKVRSRMEEVAADSPDDSWLFGQGWNPNEFEEGRWPHREDLESSVISQPVVLESHDRHTIWLNTAALETLNINRQTSDPDGGTIMRDASGEPTGVLKEKAIYFVYNRLPSPEDETLRTWMDSAVEQAFEHGVTCVHDIGPLPAFRTLRSLSHEGRTLPTIHYYVTKEHWEAVNHQKHHNNSKRQIVSLEGLKLFADGTLGSQTAALLAPYRTQLNGQHTKGELVQSRQNLVEWISRAADRGFPTMIHAIGDRAVRVSLDAFEAVSNRTSLHSPNRVEHAQFVHPEDRRRFADLDITASMQPCHLYQDRAVIEKVMPDRMARAFPLQSLLQHDANLVLGTDVPIERMDPMRNLQAAVHRGEGDATSFVDEERISIEQALHRSCVSPARLTGDGSIRGSLKPGKLADFVVLSRDPTDVPPEKIGQVSIEHTFVRGECAY